MKVLVTGFTAKGIGSGKNVLEIATAANCLPRALRECGIEVDHKAVTPGDDLSEYDKVIVFAFAPNSLPSSYLYGGLYTLLKRQDAYIALDDWQTKDIKQGCGTFAREGHWRLWKRVSKAGNSVGKKFFHEAQPYKKEMEDLITQLAFEKWPYKVLAPVYKGGDVSQLGIDSEQIIPWDPTPVTDSYKAGSKYNQSLFSNINNVPFDYKEKEWIMASLIQKQNWFKRQEFKWPVTCYGNPNLEQRRLTEPDLYNEYLRVRGILIPPHYHTLEGSGWWRVRYGMIADAGCIAYGEVEETKLFGESYKVPLSDIEKMNNNELDDLADSQKKDFNSTVWNKNRLNTFISDNFL